MITHRLLATGLLLLAFTSVITARSSLALTIELPQESVGFKPGPGSELAAGLCLICHSSDYVTTQPPTLSRAAWTATVTKMQKAFGAPISDAQVEPLVDYFVKNYGLERAR
jgi:sulfite dehydrogenase